MVHSEMMSELRAGVQKLAYAHIRRAFPARTSPVDHLPSISEVVVEPFHGCTHPGVSVSVLRGKCFCHVCTPVGSLATNKKQDWRGAFWQGNGSSMQTTDHEKEDCRTGNRIGMYHRRLLTSPSLMRISAIVNGSGIPPSEDPMESWPSSAYIIFGKTFFSFNECESC